VTENAAPTVASSPASGPTVAPRPQEPKLDAKERLFAEMVETLKKGQETQAAYYEQQAQLLKEHTQAVMANTRVMEDLYDAIVGEDPTPENPDGTDGLMDLLATLDESTENLDTRVTGLNMLLSRYSWVFDRLSEIVTGTADSPELEAGKEPEAGKVYRQGRAPVFRDMVAAVREFDETAEKEALAEMEAEERRRRDEASAPGAPTVAAKPSMVANKPKPPPPVFRSLPPPSVK
jgi:hypothetical protein